MSALISQYRERAAQAEKALSEQLSPKQMADLKEGVKRQAGATRSQIEQTLEVNPTSDILDDVDHQGEAVAREIAEEHKIKDIVVIGLMAAYAEAYAKLLYEIDFQERPLTDQPRKRSTPLPKDGYADGL